MATPDDFHHRVKSIMPDFGDLRPDEVYVAILKRGTDPTGMITKSDITCGPYKVTDQITNLCATYRQLYGFAKDLVFQLDFKTINETSIIGELNWRHDTLIVLQAVDNSDSATRITATSSESDHVRLASNTSDVPDSVQIKREFNDSEMSDLSVTTQNGADPSHSVSSQLVETTAQSDTTSTLPEAEKSNTSTQPGGMPTHPGVFHGSVADSVMSSALPGPSMSTMTADVLPEELEIKVQQGQSLLQELKNTLKDQEANNPDVAHLLPLIDKVQCQAKETKIILGVLGGTGSGKSSMINALLDEPDLLPKSCMRACTAVPCEISYNYGAAPYRAEVEFWSEEIWAGIVAALFQSIRGGEQNTEEVKQAEIAYAMLQHVYPSLTRQELRNKQPEQLLADENLVCLGSVRQFENFDRDLFCKELSSYVDSKEKPGTKRAANLEQKGTSSDRMEFWPLIKVVRIFVKADVLSTGLVIVDLPGVNDSNKARENVTQEYLKDCTAYFIVAPIERAVDDKCAATLRGDLFKRQLILDGCYVNVTFICSKTDIIDPKEAAKQLGLTHEVENLWSMAEDYEKQFKQLEERLALAKESKIRTEAAFEQANCDMQSHTERNDDTETSSSASIPNINGTKRKSTANPQGCRKSSRTNNPHSRANGEDTSNQDSRCGFFNDHSSNEHVSQNPSMNTITAAGIDDLGAATDSSQRKLSQLTDEIRDLNTQIQHLRKQVDAVNCERFDICISGRNEYAENSVRKDFVEGLRAFDQEAADEADPDNFDPTQDMRDYEAVGKRFPVFEISSKAYQKRMCLSKKNDKVEGFKSISETQIPQLQLHCIKLTEPGRIKSARQFLNSLDQLLDSLRLWSSSDEKDRGLPQAQKAREILWLEHQLNNFDKAVKNQVLRFGKKLNAKLEKKIIKLFDTASRSASAQAVSTAERWSQKIDHVDRTAGGLGWPVYKATCRRNGEYKEIDFNAELNKPFLNRISGSWEETFQKGLRAELADLPAVIDDIVMKTRKTIQDHCVDVGGSGAPFVILANSQPTHMKCLKDVVEAACALLQQNQRGVNRVFTPVIQENMLNAYAACTNETGGGQYVRMKHSMREHLKTRQNDMFKESSTSGKVALQVMVKEVEQMLLARVHQACGPVKRNITSAAMGNTGSTPGLRREVREILEGVEF